MLIPVNRPTHTTWLLVAFSVMGIVALSVVLGQQQTEHSTLVALQADYLWHSTNPVGVQHAPLFGGLLALLETLPFMAQLLWITWLWTGIMLLEKLAQRLLGSTPQRFLFLGLIFFASLCGLYQLTTINFQLYWFIILLLLTHSIIVWLSKKTAPIKKDPASPWLPVWADVLLGLLLGVSSFEVGYSITLLALLGALLTYQHRSTVLPATWQHRCVLGVRWVWLTLAVVVTAIVLWRFSLNGNSLIAALPPLWQIPPLLPEWATWHQGLSTTVARGLALLVAFFPWHSWLLVALWDLWGNDKKGGLKASFFLDAERPALRLLSIAGLGAGIIWIILPSCWLAWGLFLLSSLLIIADWLAAACVLVVEPQRFQHGFMWISLTLLGLGLNALIWVNYTQSYQLSTHAAALQIVQSSYALWCVLGGCIGLILHWLTKVKPKQASIGLGLWFLGWLFIQTLGVTPLFTWQEGSFNTVLTHVATYAQQPNTWQQLSISLCETAESAKAGIFPQLLGHTTVQLPVSTLLRVRPIASCLATHSGSSSNALGKHWLLLPEASYYAYSATHQREWGRPALGVFIQYYRPIGIDMLPTVLLPLSLPWMVQHQAVWVLVPLVQQPVKN
jgi:hypothetical protein